MKTGLYSCTSSYMGGAGQRADRVAEYERCLTKGRAYFKEIGSWPKLSDGRDVEVVAAERCTNAGGAFDGIK